MDRYIFHDVPNFVRFSTQHYTLHSHILGLGTLFVWGVLEEIRYLNHDPFLIFGSVVDADPVLLTLLPSDDLKLPAGTQELFGSGVKIVVFGEAHIDNHPADFQVGEYLE